MAIKDLVPIQKHLFICNGGSCKLMGAEESTTIIRRTINEANLTDEVHTTKTLCNGRCKDGPIVICVPQGIWYKNVLPERAEDFVKISIMCDHIQQEHFLHQYETGCICTSE